LVGKGSDGGFGFSRVLVGNGAINVRDGVGVVVGDAVTVGENVNVKTAVGDGKAVFVAVGTGVRVRKSGEAASIGSIPSPIPVGVGEPGPVLGIKRSVWRLPPLTAREMNMGRLKETMQMSRIAI
jgi:hypothetical protein